jgi:hypothetical protein
MHRSFRRKGRLGWRASIGTSQRRVSAELHLLSGRFNVGFDVDADEKPLRITICLALFSLYLAFETPALQRLAMRLLRGSYEGRVTSLRIFDQAIWWDCWAPSMSWSSREPWWMRWAWHPLDTFFGQMKHSEREVSRTVTVVPMPEKAYPCHVVMKAETWKRPRLPWTSGSATRAHIECADGVPFPGKGESAHDCGDDAMFGMTCEARTVEEGVAAFVEAALKNRQRYGGSINWQQHKHA